MNKTILTLAIASLSLIACKKEEEKKAETPETTTETPAAEPETAAAIPDSATINKAWTEYAAVGEAQKLMAMEDGKWTGEMTMWMDANAKPTKSTTTAEYKMVLGGRYQEGTYKGNFMGMPFEGKGTLAYDNATQEYISTWIDNMGTGIMIMKGKYDPATKMFSFEGDAVDPVTKKTRKMRETITIVDDNTRKMEMYDTGYDGKEFKNMEIISTRKK
ncbi:hypothetical protein FEDK69T_01090 [Flavobacterium enshiense DK69]|uniref:DUF1579 domain-containing protein n=1 Tax=Flavobacterium enshiense DK69 TaxID=1107311 RepID=V6SFW8_9FLAO|nr:DUF1579 domain-containing protein [Flavobacterium enshiense]ESU25142.1 hypothetical protein FEDK69T_01090 [Flavobacterium enshiense DK69]KGO96962.1 hypothetical protein Q767_04510 [Flavobacterium enshiense DK69]